MKPHHIERHCGFDMVPRVAVPTRKPGNHSAGELQRSNPCGCGVQFVTRRHTDEWLGANALGSVSRVSRGVDSRVCVGSRLRGVLHERFADCRAEQRVKRTRNEWCFHDVPLEQLFVGSHEWLVVSRRPDGATQPPVRRVQTMRAVAACELQATFGESLAKFAGFVDAYVTTWHEWCVVFVRKHPVDFFWKV